MVMWHIQNYRKVVRFNRIARKLFKENKIAKYIPAKDFPHFFIALVVMIRGEDDYLLEWIEFHLMMGVEHFFIYHNDNGLEKNTKILLQPYIEKRIVTYIPWPDVQNSRDKWDDLKALSVQQLAYGHCTLSFRHHFKWLIKIDIDEFIYPRSKQFSSVAEVLKTLDGNKITTINVNRTEFGSNGHRTRPQGLVIESYTLSADCFFPEDTKAIGNSDYLANDLYSTAFNFRCNFSSRLRRKLFGYPRELRNEYANSLFVVNHFQTKSLEEYQTKFKINAKGYMLGKETIERFYELDERAGKVENKEIMRFLPELKRRLSKRPNGVEPRKLSTTLRQ
jgi:Glycosyltransferase family 92